MQFEPDSPDHEIAAARICLPGHALRSRCAARLARRRRQGDRRRAEPDADDGVPPRDADAAGRPAQARRSCARSRSPPTACALGAMVRWRDIQDDARLRTAHPLLKAAIAHVAHYQIRNRGTVGGSIAHADPAAEMPGIVVTCEAQIARRRQVRRARDHGRRFLSRRADDRARARRDHHRDPAAGVAGAAGAGASRNSRAGAAISRWRRRRCSMIRTRAARRSNAHVGIIGVGDRAAAAAEVEAVAQRPARSTRRRSRAPRRSRPLPSMRRRTSTRAPPIAARSPAPWSSARCKTPRPANASTGHHADQIRSQRQAGQVDVEARTDARRLPAPSSAADRHACRLRARRLRRLHRASSTATRCAPA